MHIRITLYLCSNRYFYGNCTKKTRFKKEKTDR